MRVILLFSSCLSTVVFILPVAKMSSVFGKMSDYRVGSNIQITVPAYSAIQCSAKCLASGGCLACNWHEATRTCELLGAHDTPVAAPGYTALMSKAKSEDISKFYSKGKVYTQYQTYISFNTMVVWNMGCMVFQDTV